MANITLLGASYTDVPAVVLPQTGGGTVTFYENGGVSATAHEIYLEFSDSTSETIELYYDDNYISSIITSYQPTTYDNKDIILAQLDGVTWYEYSPIPIGVELIDYANVTNDYVVGNTGEVVYEQWYSVSDYTPIAAGMTFTYAGCRWWNMAFYDSSKNYISHFNMYNDTTESPLNSNIGLGSLSGNEIPSNAAYVRISGTYGADDPDDLSLVRTA